MPKLKGKKGTTPAAHSSNATNNGIRNYFISKTNEKNEQDNEKKTSGIAEISNSDSSDFEKISKIEKPPGKKTDKLRKRKRVSNDKKEPTTSIKPKRISQHVQTIDITRNSKSEDESILSKLVQSAKESFVDSSEENSIKRKRGRPPKRKLDASSTSQLIIGEKRAEKDDPPIMIEPGENLVQPSPCKSTISTHSAHSTVSSLFEFEKGASGSCFIVDSSESGEEQEDEITIVSDQENVTSSSIKIVSKRRRRTIPIYTPDTSNDEIMEVDIVINGDSLSQSSKKVKTKKETITPVPTPSRRSSRIQKIEEGKKLSQIHSTDSSEFDEKEEEEDFVSPVKKKKPVKIAPIFLKGKEKEVKEKEVEKPKRVISDDVLAFLHSGVPDQILKAQKQVDKKQEEEGLFASANFPQISHVGYEKTNEFSHQFTFDIKNVKFISSPQHLADSDLQLTLPSLGSFYKSLLPADCIVEKTLCDLFFPCDELKRGVTLIPEVSLEDELDELVPWVEKHKVPRRKCLAVDSNQISEVNEWLKEWRNDIKDDGGTSRKEERKKRTRRSADKFVIDNSEDEDEWKDKSLIICGPPGIGKTTAVYTLAKKLGFKVIEMNFSSRRSGREVLAGVEEATLSLNLDEAQNDQNGKSSCLVLFEDVDLYHHEEDEGFGAAVSQLITGACRPIVMTTSNNLHSPVDPKIEKREPRWIAFEKQSSSLIASKALVPIIRNEFSIEEESLSDILPTLEFIVRSTGQDVRRSINQAQFLLANWDKKPEDSVRTLCPHLDSQFITWLKRTELLAWKSESKSEEWDLLNSLSQGLSFISDLDSHSSLRHHSEDGEPSGRHGPLDLVSTALGTFLGVKQKTRGFLNFYRALTLRNDDDMDKAKEIKLLQNGLEEFTELDDYEGMSFIRTIHKRDLKNSSWKTAKRHGRQSFYFNRLGQEFSLCKRIVESLRFNSEPDLVDVV